jgi:hypothetical protein
MKTTTIATTSDRPVTTHLGQSLPAMFADMDDLSVQ